MSGYTIAIERGLALGVNAGAKVLHRVPDTLKYGWLHLPTSWDGILDAEVSALAWTVAAANVVVAWWIYCQLSGSGLLQVGVRESKSVLRDH